MQHMGQNVTDDTPAKGRDDMYTCVCTESFETTDDLESHLLGLPDTDTRDHYEVTERGRAPALARGRVDPRIAWGIRRVRIERGWTQAEVARLFGCSHTRVCRIERGERGTPSPEVVADLLGTTVRDLLTPCPDCRGKPPQGCQCLRCGFQYKESLVIKEAVSALSARYPEFKLTPARTWNGDRVCAMRREPGDGHGLVVAIGTPDEVAEALEGAKSTSTCAQITAE